MSVAPPAAQARAASVEKRAVVGTAGHVDHGKTALVRALTGIETDRLKEERERGISIELGFAHWKLPSGRLVGIVDVPGHERFVRAMVAGAGGMDLAMLVVAADEGVRPQTREHLDILTLLGVARGVVVLTKRDLVEPDWLELQSLEVREALAGCALADAPLLAVSAVSGEGLPELAATVDGLLDHLPERDATGLARLPVDRVFTLKGFGTVVTGTLLSGSIGTGEELESLPSGRKVRVRGIQVHGRAVERARAGQRTALNLAGVERSDVARGDVLATRGYLSPSFLLDVSVRLLPAAKPVRHRQRLRVHLGTREVLCRAVPLSDDELAPGEEALVQLYCERAVACVRGERLILRTYSPPRTVGGGTVVDPRPKKHRRRDAAVLAALGQAREGAPSVLAGAELRRGRLPALTREGLARAIGIPVAELASVLADLPGLVAIGDRWLVLEETLGAFEQALCAELGGFHVRAPLLPGAPKEELREKVAAHWEGGLFHAALLRAAQAGRVVVAADLVRLPTHRVALTEGDERGAQEIADAYLRAGFQTPSPDAFLKDPRRRPLFEHLARQGTLVRASPEIYFHRDAVEEARRRLAAHAGKAGGFTVTDAKDLLATSRKYLIPLLEHLDGQGFTLRVGERRVLRK